MLCDTPGEYLSDTGIPGKRNMDPFVKGITVYEMRTAVPSPGLFLLVDVRKMVVMVRKPQAGNARSKRYHSTHRLPPALVIKITTPTISPLFQIRQNRVAWIRHRTLHDRKKRGLLTAF